MRKLRTVMCPLCGKTVETRAGNNIVYHTECRAEAKRQRESKYYAAHCQDIRDRRNARYVSESRNSSDVCDFDIATRYERQWQVEPFYWQYGMGD